MRRKRVGILIFQNVELLDFCGPYEIFSVARLDEGRRREELSPFEVLLVAATLETVRSYGGMRVIPDVSFDTCPPLDILIVPGGMGVRREIDNSKLIEWIAFQGKKVEVLASVCTGSMLLAKAGFLGGKRATTHHSAVEWMRTVFPDVEVVQGERIVEEANILTSAGVSAGIDLALRLVEKYCGSQIAVNAARHIEYPYYPIEGI
ncbi:MAG: DJ-1/PfpI family protein [Acidobacteriota bacterium]|nr:DJ-1/PfpI family protein [Blastocatellia bacterium]MDW8411585.1 DJ-1/PfpI family protein [Acidobacteriota bacterium]